jgi:hypothetical protein
MPRRRKRKRRKSGLGETVNQLFHPSARNDHRSKLLHAESILYFSLIVVAAFALVRAIRFFPGIENSILGYASNITAEEVLTQTNEQRAAEGLPEVVVNEELSAAALAKGQDMFQDQYWSHTAPDGDEPWDFIESVGYRYKTAGENLARDFMNTSDMFQAWMASPTHQANILNPQFEEIGIAVIDGKLQGFETTLVVQMFGTPNTEAAAVRPNRLLDSSASQGGATEQVLAGSVVSPSSLRSSVLFTPLQLTKAFFLAVIILIVFTLVYDSFIASNRRVSRLISKNLGHLMVFGAATFILIFFKSGMVN